MRAAPKSLRQRTRRFCPDVAAPTAMLGLFLSCPLGLLGPLVETRDHVGEVDHKLSPFRILDSAEGFQKVRVVVPAWGITAGLYEGRQIDDDAHRGINRRKDLRFPSVLVDGDGRLDPAALAKKFADGGMHLGRRQHLHC